MVALAGWVATCGVARAWLDGGIAGDAGSLADGAQRVETSDAAAPAPEQADGAVARVPPRVLSLPAIELADAPAAPEAVHAVVLVARDGSATLASCEAGGSICAAIAAALREARFVPAQVAGRPRAARVQVRFFVRARDARAGGGTEGTGASASQRKPSGGAVARPSGPEPDAYGAVARLRETRPTAHALELAELRELPGAFGDPFRAIEALPGVLPVVSGLPYVYVRGAPPGATAYYYDDIPVPVLFHFALGPAVVHPAMVGPIDFYPGVAPARFGRKTGGVVAGQASERALRPGLHGELELRLVDMQAYVATPLPRGGRLEAGARYGYPGVLVKLFEPRAVLQYWDYQVRASTPLSADTALSLVLLGSYDLLGRRENGRVARDIELQFHRLEARAVTRRRALEVGYALSGGLERSGLGDEFAVQAVRLGPRFWLTTRAGRAKLRVGADMLASYGALSDPRERSGDGDDSQMLEVPPDAPASSGRNPIYASATTRNAVGVYAELVWPFAPRWLAESGLRADLWLTAGDAQAAVEPRLLIRRELHDRLAIHAAAGLAYQPAVFLIPLPGIADVALDRGLQRAIQTELGLDWQLPASFRASLKAYAHFYDQLLSFEALGDDADDVCAAGDASCDATVDLARMSAYSYGSELLVRRAFSERLSGWLAYTLSWAGGQSDRGEALTPSFDVRHVGNLMLQWRISAKWHVSTRGYAQSGRFAFNASSSLDPRERRRLPMFFRGDLQIARLWQRSWGELRFTFDWLNFTFQREPLRWYCEEEGLQSRGPRVTAGSSDSCQVEYTSFPITLPMLGVRGSY